MDIHVVPECYVDTMLIKVLVPPKRRWNHQHGCRNVSRELEKGKLKDKFGVGIIDDDKSKPEYLKQFKLIDKFLDDNGCGVALYKKMHHYFILICPAIEAFILQISFEEGINLKDSDYDLPVELEELCKITKSQYSEHDERFIRLFKKFKQTENPKLKRLTRWLKILIDKNYKVDIKDLLNA